MVPPAQFVRRALEGKMVPHQGDHPLHQPAVKGVGEDGRDYRRGFILGHTLEIKAMFIYHFLLPFISLSQAAKIIEEPLTFKTRAQKYPSLLRSRVRVFEIGLEVGEAGEPYPALHSLDNFRYFLFFCQIFVINIFWFRCDDVKGRFHLNRHCSNSHTSP